MKTKHEPDSQSSQCICRRTIANYLLVSFYLACRVPHEFATDLKHVVCWNKRQCVQCARHNPASNSNLNYGTLAASYIPINVRNARTPLDRRHVDNGYRSGGHDHRNMMTMMMINADQQMSKCLSVRIRLHWSDIVSHTSSYQIW